MNSLSSRQTLFDKSVPWSYLLFGLVYAGGLFLRWLELDARPVHHDESLHYMYGRYFFDFPEQNFHRYDPMLHGPLLYNVLRLVYETFGSSTWAGRAFVAILGSAFMFVPLLFRRYFRPLPLFLLTCAIAFSPTTIYWSRFLREDILQVWATVLVFYGALIARDNLKPVIILLGISLQWCIKANVFVHGAIVLGFILFEYAFNLLVRRKNEGLIISILRSLKRYEGYFIGGFVLAAFVFIYFYTSGFRYSAGILDGLWRKSFAYWLNQHSIERIPGPFLFHFFQLSWYEFVFMIGVFSHLAFFYRRASRPIQFAGAAVLAGAISLGFATLGGNIEKHPIFDHLNVKDSLDLMGCILIAGHAVLVTVQHLLDGKRGLAFFGYFFFAVFFSYSYLGEKVPWLAIYPFLSGVVYLVLFFQNHFERFPWAEAERYPWWKVLRFAGMALCVLGLIFLLQDEDSYFKNIPEGINTAARIGLAFLRNATVLSIGLFLLALSAWEYFFKTLGYVHLYRLLFVAALLFNLRAAYMVNIVNGGKASEFMSQVHTTKEFHDFALEIRRQIEVPTSGKKPTVYVTGEATWPSTWYFVDLPQYKFHATPEELDTFDYRIQNWESDKSKQFPGYRRIDLNLRGWWVPDYRAMTLQKFLRYSLSQVPWNPLGGGAAVGYSYVTALVKEKQ